MTLKTVSMSFIVASTLLVGGASLANAGNCQETMATWCFNHTTKSVEECADWAYLMCSVSTGNNHNNGAKTPRRTGTRFKLHTQTFGTKRPATMRQIRVRRMRIHRTR